jgi:hypothetical protein
MLDRFNNNKRTLAISFLDRLDIFEVRQIMKDSLNETEVPETRLGERQTFRSLHQFQCRHHSGVTMSLQP